ncbi:MAG: sigma-54-dependent Fis family transcriptional regulator [Fibrobacteres bacterium]|nr:sigma-54-dependent Fis family transcriptional regulator [Fibrobacterota bacterium]
MKTDDFPDSLSGCHFIEIAGVGDRIVIVSDEKGRFCWVDNSVIHTWSRLVELLRTQTLFDLFDLPCNGNLNDIFEALPISNPARISNNHLADSKDWPTGWYREWPTYPSKPGKVESAIAPFFITKWPLLKLAIFRLSPTRFASIISFRGLMTWLSQNENRIIAFCNKEGIITSLSALFARPTGVENPVSLLGRKISELMKFSKTSSSKDEENCAVRLVLKWKSTDTHFPLHLSENGDAELLTPKEGFKWTNKNSSLYSYLEWDKPLYIDNHSIDISINYSSDDGSFPSIILRGSLLHEFSSPDTLGYALTSTINEKTVRFRKSCVNVRVMNAAERTKTGQHEILIRKRGTSWTFFYNGENIGDYEEHLPFSMETSNRFLLYLRPGESVNLHEITIRSGKSNSPIDKNSLTTAWYVNAPEVVHYHVRMEDGVVGNENYTLYHFHDITPFMRNIKELNEERDRLGRLVSGETQFIGQSEKMVAIREEARKTADSPLSILIEGETGTGKEVLARFIHANSSVSDGPFVRIDCASLPETLLESELFGHEAGAFTGAIGSRPGLFEKAHGGTVFLDEVGNLPLSAQAKLLGVLESGEIQRLGGRSTIKVRFRLISASNESFSYLLKAKRLREDLYFRLNQHRFVLPPLRERGEDAPILAHHFLETACAVNRKQLIQISKPAMQQLVSHAWPGNIRELRNVMYRAVVLCNSNTITAEDLTLYESDKDQKQIKTGTDRKNSRRTIIDKEKLTSVLHETGGNLLYTAEKLNMSRTKIYRLIRKHKLNPDEFRDRPFD